METNFRALCAELLNGLDEIANPRYPFPGYTRCAMNKARAALAAEPVGDDDRKQALNLLTRFESELGYTDLRPEHIDLLRSVISPAPPLSPAAQAVLDAFNAELASQTENAICLETGLVAVVLRAVADPQRSHQHVRTSLRHHILAIAAELGNGSI